MATVSTKRSFGLTLSFLVFFIHSNFHFNAVALYYLSSSTTETEAAAAAVE